MRRWLAVVPVLLLVFGATVGCSTDDASSSADSATQDAAQSAKRAREKLEAKVQRLAARLARRAEAVARRKRERKLEAQALAEQTADIAPEPVEPEPAESCHSDYDPCLDPNAYDYDCEGGEGNGPEYTGQVTVKGSDPYDLDSDDDGLGCEPY
ncbi:MAG: hypothetical protein JW895_14030 [Thermoleophilaceae bacterium]|nr:hypothetical protein [Thermoleophilaceae bacterium]